MERDDSAIPVLRQMSLGDHLEELRRRVFWSLIAVGVCMLVCWVLYRRVIVEVMKAPLDMAAGRYENPFVVPNPVLDILRAKLPRMAELGNLNVMSVFSDVIVRFKVSLLAGGILASPYVIGQIWKFVESGLYDREKKYVARYGIASLALFLMGCFFSFFMLFPIAIAVLLGDSSFIITLRLEEYVSQATFFTVGVGSIFEMPLVVLFLAAIGVVDVTSLRASRRHVILGILVVAAILTPPDPLTQIVVAVPMLLLYEFSIILLRCKGGK